MAKSCPLPALVQPWPLLPWVSTVSCRAQAGVFPFAHSPLHFPCLPFGSAHVTHHCLGPTLATIHMLGLCCWQMLGAEGRFSVQESALWRTEGHAGIWVALEQRLELTPVLTLPTKAGHFIRRLSQQLSTRYVHQPGWCTSGKWGRAGISLLT